MPLRKLLITLKERGYHFRAYYDPTEIDYIGFDVAKTMEAMKACDVMNLDVLDEAGKRSAWLLYIPELEPDERIADYSAYGILDELLNGS